MGSEQQSGHSDSSSKQLVCVHFMFLCLCVELIKAFFLFSVFFFSKTFCVSLGFNRYYNLLFQHEGPIRTIHWIKAPNYSCVMTGSWDKTLKVLEFLIPKTAQFKNYSHEMTY